MKSLLFFYDQINDLQTLGDMTFCGYCIGIGNEGKGGMGHEKIRDPSGFYNLFINRLLH